MKWKTNVHIVINVSHILKFGKMQTYSAKKKEKKKKRKRRNKKTTFNDYLIKETLLFCWGVYGVYRHFHQYFSYILVVIYIGGGNQTTRRKPPTCRKSLTNFIT